MWRMFSLLLLTALLAACSGIKPYQPENHREEGPPGGLLTGPAGAFEIGVQAPAGSAR